MKCVYIVACIVVYMLYLRGGPFDGNLSSMSDVIVIVLQVSRHAEVTNLYFGTFQSLNIT